MLDIKELAKKIAVWVNGEYSGFGWSARDMLGATADNDTYKVLTGEDIDPIKDNIDKLNQEAKSIIKSTVCDYQLGKSQTQVPTGDWNNTIPAVTKSKPYLWTRIQLIYMDGTNSIFLTVSGGSSDEGGGGGGGGKTLTLYNVPQVLDGTDYTDAQKTYWMDNNFPVKTKLLTVNNTNESGTVSVDDTPTTDTPYNDGLSSKFVAAQLKIRYRWPNFEDSNIYPLDLPYLVAQANNYGVIVDQIRIKTSDGQIYSSSTANNVSVKSGSKFGYGSTCFSTTSSYRDYTLTTPDAWSNPYSPYASSLYDRYATPDYSDAKSDYNSVIPQIYFIAFGDCSASFSNGIWHLTKGTTGGWYMLPYVGKWAAPMWLYGKSYNRTYVHGVYTVKYTDTPLEYAVPTKTNPNPSTISNQWVMD